MADSKGFIGRTVGGVFSNALYDTLKLIFGGGVVALGAVIWQYIKRRPVDWWGMLALGMFVAIVLGLLARLHSHPSQTTIPLAPSPQGGGDQWKTKWHWKQKFQAENSEKIKLEAAISAQREPLLTPLQVEVFTLHRKLRNWHQGLTDAPALDQSLAGATPEVLERGIIQRAVKINEWSNKMGYDYADKFSSKMKVLVNRLGAKGLDVSGIAQYSGSYDGTVTAIKALEKLFFEIEEK